MKNIITNKISDLLQEEWITYNLFLDELNISTLPKYYYKDGKVIEYEERYKTPILTTEDNVELFGGESIYSVTDDFQLCYTSIATKENVQGVRVFAKKEVAEEHILMNKPLLSLNDLLSVWGDTNTLDVYSNSPLFTKFKKLANEKLRRKN